MRRTLHHIFFALFWLGFFLRAGAQDTVQVSAPVTDAGVSVETDTDTHKGAVYFNEGTEVPPMEQRAVPDTTIQRLKADDAYWYANTAPPKQEQPRENTSSPLPSWIKPLFWVLAILGFVVLLVWFLASGNIFLFRRTPKEIDKAEGEESPTEDIFGMDFELAIRKAVAARDYRLAVRLMYLQTLRNLSDHNLIHYGHEKTNSDYLLQLAGSSYYRAFFRLTRDFEYTWYGGFPIPEGSFLAMQNDFSHFKAQVSS